LRIATGAAQFGDGGQDFKALVFYRAIGHVQFVHQLAAQGFVKYRLLFAEFDL
jgi:hypothetical protein